MKYQFLEHTADIKIQAFGNTIEKAFENSALALKESICGKIKVKDETRKKISLSGKDKESLFYRFLEEFLFLLDARGFLLSKIINLKINEKKNKQGYKLTAELGGDKSENYKFTNNVKAITYNQMHIKKEKNKFVCQFVLDV